MAEPQLTGYLDKIRSVFDIDELLAQKADRHLVVDYYTQSAPGYTLFHSTAGAVHMAVNPSGIYHKEGFYGQADMVQQHIEELHPDHVLELAAGKGFNSIYLARRNPDVIFKGLDLTSAHVQIARRNSSELSNLSFQLGDFHDLPFAPGSFGLVFVVESLCHASDMRRALSEAYAALRPGGRFIVIDGYRQPGFEQLSDEVRTAARLVEASMAVDRFHIIDDWLRLAQDVGFEVCDVEELTSGITPTLLKQQRLARLYFSTPVLSRLMLRCLPPLLVRNSIAGLLMPLTVQTGAHGYYAVTLGRGVS